jgi:hypothetical protein
MLIFYTHLYTVIDENNHQELITLTESFYNANIMKVNYASPKIQKMFGALQNYYWDRERLTRKKQFDLKVIDIPFIVAELRREKDALTR